MDSFRTDIPDEVLNALKARQAMHNNRYYGDAPDSNGKESMRLPAYAYITKEGGPDIRMSTVGFVGRYDKVTARPRRASLLNVTIKRVTGYAPKVNLTLEVDVEFEVYTHTEFEEYASAYLRRDTVGSPVKLTWGHIKDFDGRGIVKNEVEGYVLAGGFNNTDLNTYNCKFRMIIPSSAIPGIDVLSSFNMQTAFPNEYFLYNSSWIQLWFQNIKRVPITGIPTKILHDLQTQTNSTGKITSTKVDGAPIAFKKQYQTWGDVNPTHVGIVYTKNIGFAVPWYHRFFRQPGESTGDVTDSLDYISLEYIVWLINQTSLKTSSTRVEGDEIKFSIDFEEEPYSLVTKDYLFRSGNPMSVLFLGGGSGNYEFEGVRNGGKNFEEKPSIYTSCVVGRRLNHRYILINREEIVKIITDSLQEAEKAKQDVKEQEGADNRGSDKVLDIATFFEKIFFIINRASGGYVKLSLTNYSVDEIKKSRGAMHKIRIADLYATSAKTPNYFEFDPLRGDGSTLSLAVEGQLPNDLLGYTLASGMGEGSSTAGQISKQEKNEPTTDINELIKLLTSLQKTTLSSGGEDGSGLYPVLADSGFDSSVSSEVCDAMSQYRKMTMHRDLYQAGGDIKITEFFDVELKVTMEGVYPILAGNGFTSTNLPRYLRLSNKVFFATMTVDDKIEAPGVWTTEISTRLSPYV